MSLEKWTQEDGGMPWFADHSNLVVLASYLAENHYSGQDVAYAMEKPWKYESEFWTARKEMEGGTDTALSNARALASSPFECLVQISGDTLDNLFQALEPVMQRSIHNQRYPYRLRIAVDAGQLKVKVNEETWTAPLGHVTTGEDAR